MTAEQVRFLADEMALAQVAVGIPTGDLYRDIAHDRWLKARAALHAAINELAAPAPVQQQPLTPEQAAAVADDAGCRQLMQRYGLSIQALIRAVEVAHGITGSKE